MKIVRAACLALLFAGASARAEAAEPARRYAVVIGNNLGDRDDVELRYAEADAARMTEVLRALGNFAPESTILLQGENADTVQQTLIRINDEIRRNARPDEQSLLLVYYSGHADAERLHLGRTGLELKRLEQLVRGSSAALRVLVVDACRSGALTRVKGGVAAPPFAVRVQARLAGQGVVFLTASAAGEDAQESDSLQSSFFTHFFVSGLLGAADTDGDGAVGLIEAYHHAYEGTLRATSKTWAGTQHPTFRYEFQGQGDIPLTSLRASGARRGSLVLPPGRSYLIFSGSSTGEVVAEVGADNVARRLSTRPGTYFIRGRGPDDLLEGTVKLGAGETLVVAEKMLTRSAYARLVRKGASPHHVVHGLQAGYRLRTPLDAGKLCQGAFLGYTAEFRYLSVVPRLGFCRGGFTNEHLGGRTDEVDAEVRLLHSWDVKHVSFDLGVTGGVSLLRQSFVTRGRAPTRMTAAGMLGVTVGVTVDLPRGFYLQADVAGLGYFMRQESAGATRIAPAFTVRTAVGLGKRF